MKQIARGDLRPLESSHRRPHAESIVHAAALAHRNPAMARVARLQIKLVAWRWTADAFDPVRGLVVPDGIRHLHYTVGVEHLSRSGQLKGVRHDKSEERKEAHSCH
jgi:hypothetical protein